MVIIIFLVIVVRVVVVVVVVLGIAVAKQWQTKLHHKSRAGLVALPCQSMIKQVVSTDMDSNIVLYTICYPSLVYKRVVPKVHLS